MDLGDFTVFAAFAAFLAILLIGGTLAAGPIRRKMVVLANDLYDATISSDRLRRRIDFMLDTSASPLIAVLLIVASVATVIDSVFFSEDEQTYDFESDLRYQRLLMNYFGSVLLANPLASAFLVPLMLLCALVNRGAKGIRGIRLADAQIDRVAAFTRMRVRGGSSRLPL